MTTFRVAVGCLVAELRGVDFSLDGDGVVLPQFLTDAVPDFRVNVSAGDLPRSVWGKSLRISEQVDRQRRIVAMAVTEWQASFDLPGRIVRAQLAGRWPGAVDSLLKTAAQLYALETRRALFFHASAVERGGVGVVFLGRASAGKTTAALLSRDVGARILNEEIVCVGGPSGAQRPALHTVSLGERHCLVSGPSSVPLRRLYVLRQAPFDAVEPLAAPAAVRALASSATIGVRDELLMLPALELASSLARSVPVKLLHFRESPSFWEAIEQDLEGGDHAA